MTNMTNNKKDILMTHSTPNEMMTNHESIMDHDIIVFTKSNCVQCDQTKRRLRKDNIDFHVIDIESDNTRLTDQHYTTPYEFCTQVLGAQAAPVVLVRLSRLHPSVQCETVYGEFAVWTGFRPDYLKSITSVPVPTRL